MAVSLGERGWILAREASNASAYCHSANLVAFPDFSSHESGPLEDPGQWLTFEAELSNAYASRTII